MCQMCDEYEADLRRMGLIAEADKVRGERHPEQKPVAKSGEQHDAPVEDRAPARAR